MLAKLTKLQSRNSVISIAIIGVVSKITAKIISNYILDSHIKSDTSHLIDKYNKIDNFHNMGSNLDINYVNKNGTTYVHYLLNDESRYQKLNQLMSITEYNDVKHFQHPDKSGHTELYKLQNNTIYYELCCDIDHDIEYQILRKIKNLKKKDITNITMSKKLFDDKKII